MNHNHVLYMNYPSSQTKIPIFVLNMKLRASLVKQADFGRPLKLLEKIYKLYKKAFLDYYNMSQFFKLVD